MKNLFLISTSLLGVLLSTTAVAEDCNPYIHDMFQNPYKLYQVHGTNLYYEGNYPEHWNFAILTDADSGLQPPLSDETDHFGLSLTLPDGINITTPQWHGRFQKVMSNGNFSNQQALVIKDGRNGSAPSAYIETDNGYQITMPVDCYRINDNPKQFAMKGQFSNGSWIYNNWLFSIERMN